MSVGTLGLDNHTTQVEWVLHQFTGFLNGHTLLLAQLGQQLGILLALLAVQRVNQCSLVNVCQPALLSQCMHLVRITNQDEVGNVLCQHTVGGSQCALLLSFGEHNALLVTFGTRNNLFN